MPAPLPGERILIFAPHPDDETLGACGYMLRANSVAAHIHVVLMTNGEYGRTAMDHLPELPSIRVAGYEDYGMIRQDETKMALGVMGISANDISFLSYPNHLLARMSLPDNWLPSMPVYNARLNSTHITFPDAYTPNAPYCGEALLNDIEKIYRQEKPDVIITLLPTDIHPDHWATSFMTQYALQEMTARGTHLPESVASMDI